MIERRWKITAYKYDRSNNFGFIGTLDTLFTSK